MDNQDATQPVRGYLDAIAASVRQRPVAIARLRGEVESLLVHPTSSQGRTDANCQAVGLALVTDDKLWASVEEVEAVDRGLADVLRDMAGTLHDAVTAPDIADNFESTPEQLLRRLRGESGA